MCVLLLNMQDFDRGVLSPQKMFLRSLFEDGPSVLYIYEQIRDVFLCQSGPSCHHLSKCSFFRCYMASRLLTGCFIEQSLGSSVIAQIPRASHLIFIAQNCWKKMSCFHEESCIFRTLKEPINAQLFKNKISKTQIWHIYRKKKSRTRVLISLE